MKTLKPSKEKMTLKRYEYVFYEMPNTVTNRFGNWFLFSR